MEQNALDKIIVLYVDLNDMSTNEASEWFCSVRDALKGSQDNIPIIMLPNAVSLSLCDRDDIIAWRGMADKFLL